MSFLYNAWYPAAWSSEISGTLLPRTFLDIPVVMFRSDDGAVVALHDMCPHRFAPLSLGSLVENRVRCGYHGLEFDQSGRCVANCLGGQVPKAAKVRTFNVIEQDKIVWIWMGSGEPSDPARLQRFPFHQHDEPVVYGYTMAGSNYQLLSDNLMDLTHIHLLHPVFGGTEFPCTVSVTDEGEAITAYHLANHATAPTIEENVIRWTAPSTHFLDSISTSREGSKDVVPSSHLLAPETATTTHYLWSSGCPAGLDVEETRAVLSQVFDKEDKPMVEAVQRRMAGRDFWDMKPLLLKSDVGGVLARRKLAALIKREGEPAPA